MKKVRSDAKLSSQLNSSMQENPLEMAEAIANNINNPYNESLVVSMDI